MPENKFSGIGNPSPGWTGSEPRPISLADIERLFKTMVEEGDRLAPHFQRWSCSVCTRYGIASDQLADCPYCGGKSVHAVMVERSV